jgi:LmbE family N-acetylglucosaminyl deacetylase
MPSTVSVLALFAHPDDAEFLCAGTLAHLADRGARIHITTMTGGDCGSTVLPPDKIARVRQREAARAAKLIGATYSCMKEKDLLVFYDSPTLRKVMELLRQVSADLVFTHSPSDYMVDHETTSRLAQSACFGGMIGNFKTGRRSPAKPLRRIPHLYYAQPFGGRNILGEEINPGLCVDISSTIERKEKMLACHESQRAFLRAQQEIQDTIGALREMARQAGERSGFGWAEGFRQHLGQGFPQDDVLANLLGDLVRPARA